MHCFIRAQIRVRLPTRRPVERMPRYSQHPPLVDYFVLFGVKCAIQVGVTPSVFSIKSPPTLLYISTPVLGGGLHETGRSTHAMLCCLTLRRVSGSRGRWPVAIIAA